VRNKNNKKSEGPIYIQEEHRSDSLGLSNYVKEILNLNKLEVEKYVDFNRATEPDMISRALSVELLLHDKF